VTVTEAVEVLFRNRHHLTPDVLRSLQDIYLCASAARYGQAYESQWVDAPVFYSEHDVADCEAGDAEGAQ
jgi:hypothetical protein